MPRQASTTARGYGAAHQAERKRWASVVAMGAAVCWRCRRRILPGAPWDLGHDDWDRSRYMGPECRRCNRSAGARKRHARATRSHTDTRGTSWRW